MNKIAWIDVETTGLDPVKCDVVQVAILIEEEGNIIEEGNIFMCPHPNAMIADAALQINNRTRDEIARYPLPMEGIYKFKRILETYVSPYDKRDKLFFAGYNPSFDVDMLNHAFLKNQDPYFFSWFFSCFIDVKSSVGEHFVDSDIVLPNYKLKTVCSHFDIKFKAHDAMEDIKATRELYYELKNAVPA